jgi:hypothetical protein
MRGAIALMGEHPAATQTCCPFPLLGKEAFNLESV